MCVHLMDLYVLWYGYDCYNNAQGKLKFYCPKEICVNGLFNSNWKNRDKNHKQ